MSCRTCPVLTMPAPDCPLAAQCLYRITDIIPPRTPHDYSAPVLIETVATVRDRGGSWWSIGVEEHDGDRYITITRSLPDGTLDEPIELDASAALMAAAAIQRAGHSAISGDPTTRQRA